MKMVNTITIDNKEISLDKHGYLTDHTLWSESVAKYLAEQSQIELSEAHWEVIHFVRDFYIEFNTSPAMRALVKAIALKLGKEKGNSAYLFKLFPEGPAKQATLLAGLPKPVKCL